MTQLKFPCSNSRETKSAELRPAVARCIICNNPRRVDELPLTGVASLDAQRGKNACG
jgi:hypothetical protein